MLTRSELWEETTRGWIVIGKWLRTIAAPDETVATTAAGAIPYYSGLRSLDMLGLNDRYVAGLPDTSSRVGHRKLAPAGYLARQRITFVLGHPRTRRRPLRTELAPGESYVRVDTAESRRGGGPPLGPYLVIGTTRDRSRLIESLRARGVEVID